MEYIAPETLREALAETAFPADKETILRDVAARDVGEPAQRAFASLPPVEYANADEVLSSVRERLTPPPEESVRADPEQDPGKPTVAEWLR